MDACAQLNLRFFFYFSLSGVATPAPVNGTVPGTCPTNAVVSFLYTLGVVVEGGGEV
jgi:hypothetical protein